MLRYKNRLVISLLFGLLTLLFSSHSFASEVNMDKAYRRDLKKIYKRFSTLWRVTKKEGSGRGILGGIDFKAYNVTDEDVNDAIKNKYKLIWVRIFPEEDNLAMNVDKDEWYLVDSNGKKHKVINCINFYDQNFYFFLPGYIKETFMFYPGYAMGERETTFFLFLDKSVNTRNFKEIVYKNAYINKAIHIKRELK